MLPDPNPPEVPEFENISWFFDNWCGLAWTPWVPLSADKALFRQVPHEPGLYRIRPAGKDFLMYIGETRRTLHQRLGDLRMELRRQDRMPWSDPHAEAPALWAWHHAEGFGYECSAAPLDATDSGRRGMESFLLYRYRQERGGSTLCNFGRFHPRYRRSSTRSEGLRGGKLDAGHKDNPLGGPGYQPLVSQEKPGEPGWMGLAWSDHEELVPEKTGLAPAGPGLYLLLDRGSGEIVSIGQTGRCAERLLELIGRSWSETELQFSFHGMGKTVLPHQLKELETDLVGNYFEQYRKAPVYQFRNSSMVQADPL